MIPIRIEALVGAVAEMAARTRRPSIAWTEVFSEHVAFPKKGIGYGCLWFRVREVGKVFLSVRAHVAL